MTQRHWYVAGLLGFVIFASPVLAYIKLGAVGNDRVYSGLDLVALGLCFALLGTAVIVISAVGAFGRSSVDPSWLAVLGGLIAISAFALVFGLEIAASAIPTSLLPETVRRLTFDIGAGIGLWVAGSCGAALVVLRVDGSGFSIPNRTFRPFDLRPRPELMALLGAAVLTILVGVLRYRPWLSGTIADQESTMPGWALPYVGLGTLVSVWLLAIAVVLAALDFQTAAPYVGALGGWLASVCAAVVILASDLIAELRLNEIVPDQAESLAPLLGLTIAPWLFFASGLGTACMWILRLRSGDQTNGSANAPWIPVEAGDSEWS